MLDDLALWTVSTSMQATPPISLIISRSLSVQTTIPNIHGCRPSTAFTLPREHLSDTQIQTDFTDVVIFFSPQTGEEEDWAVYASYIPILFGVYVE